VEELVASKEKTRKHLGAHLFVYADSCAGVKATSAAAEPPLPPPPPPAPPLDAASRCASGLAAPHWSQNRSPGTRSAPQLQLPPPLLLLPSAPSSDLRAPSLFLWARAFRSLARRRVTSRARRPRAAAVVPHTAGHLEGGAAGASLLRHAARQTASLWSADLFWAQMPLLVSHE